MVPFILGLLVGGFAGMIVMSLCTVAKRSDGHTGHTDEARG